MLLKSFASAALLLSAAFATPLSITLEIKNDAFELEQAPLSTVLKENPGKGGTVGPVKKYMDLLVAQSSATADDISKLETDKIDSMISIVKGLYVQYELFNSSLAVNPKEKFSERAGDAVIKYFYNVAEGLKAEFENIVDKKDIILSYGKLDILLADDITIVQDGWIAYNDALYELLPTESQKEDFTDYSVGASQAISTAKDAVSAKSKSQRHVDLK